LYLASTHWCAKCIRAIYGISKATFNRVYQPSTHGNTLLHRAETVKFKVQLVAEALNELCLSFSSYEPTKPKRILPYPTWGLVRIKIEEMLQEPVSGRMLRRARSLPECQDIHKQRITKHSRCSTCFQLAGRIENAKDSQERKEAVAEYDQHLCIAAHHRRYFYHHNSKAM
jgi:hypothetical protein